MKTFHLICKVLWWGIFCLLTLLAGCGGVITQMPAARHDANIMAFGNDMMSVSMLFIFFMLIIYMAQKEVKDEQDK